MKLIANGCGKRRPFAGRGRFKESKITRLELVSVTSENLQVAETVIRSAGFEQISDVRAASVV